VQGNWPSLRRFVLVASLVGVTSPPLIDETQDYSQVTGKREVISREGLPTNRELLCGGSN
jgi:hypothetical protein